MAFRTAVYPLLVLLACILAQPGQAEEARLHPKAVLELFTSQGCSSCPPADALLARLARRDDIIALAYHVDYWDYIGWRDTFGTSGNSERQRAYARSWGSNRIYTPQMVVNGAEDVVGSREGDVGNAISRASLGLPVDLRIEGDTLVVEAGAQPGAAEAVVWLVTYLDAAEIAIDRGENRGQRIGYAQVVTSRQAVGMWEPQSGAHVVLPLGEVFAGPGNGAVVIVQQERGGLPGPILGAALYQR